MHTKKKKKKTTIVTNDRSTLYILLDFQKKQGIVPPICGVYEASGSVG